MMIRVDEARCNGCGACVTACPQHALTVADGVARLDTSRCNGCQACVTVCPRSALLLVIDEQALQPIAAGQVESAGASESRLAHLAPLAKRAAPWVGAALTFVGREVLPRLARSWLESRERRESGGDMASAASRSISDTHPTGTATAASGRRRRRRGGHG